MASTEVKRRRGTTAENASFTGAIGEFIYSTDDKRLYLHDASTAGGMLVPNATDARNQLVQAADIAQAVSATYTVTLSPAPAAYTKYMRVVGVVASASDGDDTLNVNGLGAKTIKKNGGADNLSAGDLVLNGLYAFVYDGTNFHLEGAGSGGLVLQMLQATVTETAVTVTSPANDDTVPLSSEGTEVASQAITLASSSNKVLVEVSFVCTPPSTVQAVVAVFRDTTCIGASAIRTNSTSANNFNMTVLDTPGGNVTYSVRCGVASGTFYVARNTTTSNFGGAANDKLILSEIKV